MHLSITLLLGLWLASCTQTREVPVTRFSPKPEDDRWMKGTVMLQAISVTSNGAALNLDGMLPTPCHELRVSEGRSLDAQGFVLFEVWSVSDPSQTCAQMMQAFSAQLPVKPGSKIKVNGQTIKS